jgi:GAF domain-containing protein
MTAHDDAVHLAKIIQQLAAGDEARRALQGVVDFAVETVDAADFAGVSIRHGKNHVDSPATTDPIVEKADALQYELREGPCLDAIYVDDMYLITDLEDERRWPRWAPAAATLGIRSSLSVRLETPDRVVGGLNLYSLKPHAFDEDDVITAHIYAMNVSALLRQMQSTEGLRVAMTTRHQIGLAQGMLMAHLGIDQQRAFEVLRRLSQDHNLKLRDVAAVVVEENGRVQGVDWSARRP